MATNVRGIITLPAKRFAAMDSALEIGSATMATIRTVMAALLPASSRLDGSARVAARQTRTPALKFAAMDSTLASTLAMMETPKMAMGKS